MKTDCFKRALSLILIASLFCGIILNGCVDGKNSLRPALSTNDKTVDEEFFKSCADAGIEAIELAPLSYDDIDYEEIGRLAEKYNVKLWSFHLPYMPFNSIDISNEKIAEQTVELMKGYMNSAHAIGIDVFIIHPSGEPIKDSQRQTRLECAKKSLKELAEYAEVLDCVIAVENLPRTCLGKNSQEIAELISADERLRVCLDTNHLMQEEISDFIQRLNTKIITTHFSDFDFINERHWLPGEGKIDWQKVMNELGNAGYKGYILYEVSFTAPWSITRDRQLTCTDFKNNFDELVAGKKPSAIGVPKENIGMWK